MITAAIEVAAAAVGGSTTIQRDTLNKGWNGRIYGSEWPRSRGRVRIPGIPIYATPIVTTTHKNSSGGFLGIGQKTAYYPSYSISMMVAFGKKLGHGSAIRFLRLYADNKLLFNAVASTASITGANYFKANQDSGSSSVQLWLDPGTTISCDVGDLIQFNAFPGVVYQVQAPVSGTGPGFVTISIWPPLNNELLQSVNSGSWGPGSIDPSPVISFPGANASPWDLSSFDPDPHDGSHVDGPVVPPGYVTFYLGDDAQVADPFCVSQLGAGNVPGYRGLACAMITYLQLANFGNHPPRIEAEIEYDASTDNFLTSGPIPGANVQNGLVFEPPNTFALPTPAASAVRFSNPNVILPYVWVFTTLGANVVAYKVDTRYNIVRASATLGPNNGGLWSPIVADMEGYLYFATAIALNTWRLFRWDGQAMQPAGLALPLGDLPNQITVWDLQASLFGNPVKVQLCAVKYTFGGALMVERTTMLPFGTADVSSPQQCVLFITKDGTPFVGPGDITSQPGTPDRTGGSGMVADADGNLWIYQSGVLRKYNCQLQSGIEVLPDFQPIECLFPPSFATTDYDLSVVGTSYGVLFYDAVDNAIIVTGTLGLAKFDIATGKVILTNLATPPWAGSASATVGNSPDQVGTFLISEAGYGGVWRYSLSSLQQLNGYTMSDWFGGSTFPGRALYDGITDSLWFNEMGGIYRVYLDRVTPSGGIGLDNVLGTLMTEAGYESPLYSAGDLSSISVGGIMVKREPHQDTLKMLMELYQFDKAESNGIMLFLPRPQTPVLTIPEIDLGSVSEPTAKEPRVQEVLTDELSVPLSVWIHYNDFARFSQEGAQYWKRISKPYITALSAYQEVTESIEKVDMLVPIFDLGPAMKQRAKWILWAQWAERYLRTFKSLGLKYARLDPTDVILVQYKGDYLETRLKQIDRGAGFAMQFEGVSQDESVYTPSTIATSSLSSGGAGGATAGGGSTSDDHETYTLAPPDPITQVDTTHLALGVASNGVVATFNDGKRTYYNPRPSIPITDPGAGQTQIWYITIYDPNFIGEIPGGPLLNLLASETPAGANVGIDGYINMGSYRAAGSGVTGGPGTGGGGTVGSGGQPPAGGGVYVSEVPFGPTIAGPFAVAHGLNGPPSTVNIHILTGPNAEMGGAVTLQPIRYDAVNVYLVASEDGLTGYVELYQ